MVGSALVSTSYMPTKLTLAARSAYSPEGVFAAAYVLQRGSCEARPGRSPCASEAGSRLAQGVVLERPLSVEPCSRKHRPHSPEQIRVGIATPWQPGDVNRRRARQGGRQSQ